MGVAIATLVTDQYQAGGSRLRDCQYLSTPVCGASRQSHYGRGGEEAQLNG
jgi:hypothetical protein